MSTSRPLRFRSVSIRAAVSIIAARMMRYHSPATCFDIASVIDWRKPSLNTLACRVYYIAADLGETAHEAHVLQKDGESRW